MGLPFAICRICCGEIDILAAASDQPLATILERETIGQLREPLRRPGLEPVAGARCGCVPLRAFWCSGRFPSLLERRTSNWDLPEE